MGKVGGDSPEALKLPRPRLVVIRFGVCCLVRIRIVRAVFNGAQRTHTQDLISPPGRLVRLAKEDALSLLFHRENSLRKGQEFAEVVHVVHRGWGDTVSRRWGGRGGRTGWPRRLEGAAEGGGQPRARCRQEKVFEDAERCPSHTG